MTSSAGMPQKIRCFLAVDLPIAVREDLRRLQQRLQGRGLRLRWVVPESLHLTLKFLGEPRQEDFEALLAGLEPPLGVGGPLHLEPRGVGAFPSPRRARVLWVGLSGDVAALARLAFVLEARVEGLGIAREGRPFSPHLTLGRDRAPSGSPGVEAALKAEEDYAGPPFSVREVVLYESRLRPEGPQYVSRKTIPLTI